MCLLQACLSIPTQRPPSPSGSEPRSGAANDPVREEPVHEPVGLTCAVSGWTVRVRAMTGDEFTIPCPDAELTSIAEIKHHLAELKPAWPARRQCLMLNQADFFPQESATSFRNNNVFEPLGDSLTLSDQGLGNGALFELLVREIEWREGDALLISAVERSGAALNLSRRSLGLGAIEAIAWAVSNQVCKRRLGQCLSVVCMFH